MRGIADAALRGALVAAVTILLAGTLGCSPQGDADDASARAGSEGDVQGIPQDMTERIDSQKGSGEDAKVSPYIEYMGQASVKIVTPEGKVIYIDPYAGDDYGDAADLVLVTHGHFDHTDIGKIEARAEDFTLITQNDALLDGHHVDFDLGYARIVPVQAGFNAMHDVHHCVGYVVTLSDGTSIYVTGDTSTTDDMRDGTLAGMGIDYAFWCSDGVYNMGTEEASEAARMVGASVNIPYHNSTMGWYPMFDESLAQEFDAPGAMVLLPGEKLGLGKP